MNNLQLQSLEGYKEWLDLPFQIHLTTTLKQSRQSAQQINRWYTRQVLTPLALHLGTRLSAVSVISTQHIHSLLIAPDMQLDQDQIAYYFAITPLINIHSIMPKVINQNTIRYVFEHLITQEASLHFFNRNYLKY